MEINTTVGSNSLRETIRFAINPDTLPKGTVASRLSLDRPHLSIQIEHDTHPEPTPLQNYGPRRSSPLKDSLIDTFHLFPKGKLNEEINMKTIDLDENIKEDLLTDDNENENNNDDDDFDWNDDPDQGKVEVQKSTRERIQEAMARRCCWHYLSPLIRRIILALSGSCMFAAIGVCIYLFLPYPTEEEKQDPSFRNVRSNVQCWMYWAAFMWHIGWVTTIVIELLPTVVSTWTKIFKGRRSESVKTYMEYYMSLKWYTGLLTMVSWNWGTWAFLLQYPFPSVHKQDYSRIIWNVYACVFVATCFLFIQKLIIQMIATSFHSFAFNDRVQESKNALKILDSLSRAEARRARQDFANRLRIRRPLSSRISFAPDDSTPTLNNLTAYSATSVGYGHKSDTKRLSNTPEILSQFQKRLQSIVLTDQPQSRTLIDNDKIDINSIEFAKKVARKLFQSLAYPVGTPLSGEEDSKRSLDVSDFRPFFDTFEEAKSAFAVFDRDGNGDLTRREFRDTVVQIYRERKALAQSMRDTSQALGKIDAMLLLISIIATVFVSLAVFNVEVWHSLVPLGSFLLALTFVFGNTAKNTFESILFLFVTHPYDAGDLVIIDEQFLMVHNLGLMGTVFIRGDGQRIYAPTTVLMTKLITNVRRSGNMGETIQINIDFRTPTELIYKLRDQVSEWVSGETRDFAGFDLRVLDIVDVNQILINLWLPYKGNWQELSKRWQRRTRFMLALKGILTDLNIRYELPTQKFTQAQEDRTFLNVKSPLSGNNSVIETPQSFAHLPIS